MTSPLLHLLLAAASLQPEHLARWPWRLLGPSAPAGRAWSVVGVPRQPKTLYVTTAGGGLWKSTNNGVTFAPVFDDQPVASTGVVAVAPSDPDVVWLGTGEPANTRANSYGDGVYKSTDGGRTWRHVYLSESRQIGAIVIHPTKPDVVWVGAMGYHWGRNEERGVYRTTDGGRTWTKTLYVDDRTGVIDLDLDPHDPQVLYACTWQRQRFGGGDMDEAGPGSGIHKSVDGGRTWRRLTEGLPADDLGKIQLAVAPRNSKILYAAVLSGEPQPGGRRTSDTGGIFRSDDAGESWRRVNPLMTSYYYQHVYVDPADDETVWMPVFELQRSTDGGKTFEKVNMRHVHNDLHSMWIDPADPAHIAVSGDAGVSITWDRGVTWMQTVLPIGQFYEVAVDDQDPYFVYGGMQDTGHWRGPSRTYDMEGITAHDWIKLRHTGDGMAIATEPKDPNVVFMVQQFGNTSRLDLRTWDRLELQPTADEIAKLALPTPVRWDWTPGFALSRHQPDVLYLGSNYVFRIDRRTGRVAVASPDLSRQQGGDPKGVVDGFHSYGALSSIAEGPLDTEILWAGADDGPLWVSNQGGASWREVTPKQAPPGCVVAEIEASRHNRATAYVAYDCHTVDEDVRPYLYRTGDLGRTWTNLMGDLPVRGSVHTVREDPTSDRVLYVGTEFGVFVTVDGGSHWVPLRGNLPTVAVRALAVQAREKDLVAGTFGRAIWITDISPFAEIAEGALGSDLHLFAVEPAVLFKERETYGTGIEEINGDLFFRAENPPYGAVVTYWLGQPVAGEVILELTDGTGTVLRTLKGPGGAGLHRVVWDLRRDGVPPPPRPLTPSEKAFRERVGPGVYGVTLRAGALSARQDVTVRPEDPNGVRTGDIRK